MKHSNTLYLTFRWPDGTRAFSEGTVIETGWRSSIVRFTDDHVADVAKDIALYHEEGDSLVVQNYKVLKTIVHSEGVDLKVRAVGVPRPFDQRVDRRLPVEPKMMEAQLGSENGCQVVDIGDESVGILAFNEYEIGDRVDLRIRMSFTRYLGCVTVRAVGMDPSGRFRYGLTCEDESIRDDLRVFLKRARLTIQCMNLQS